ncbi:MAG: glycerate kinase, partial [Bacteroidetes bacterium]
PLMRPTSSFYGISGDGRTAVIEMAAASGIEKLKGGERNPWITSTFGTGELILDALQKGCSRILIGIGGSATNDGGMGMARALGVKFLDEHGKPVGEGGGALGSVRRIETGGLDERIGRTGIRVACDVTNPLTGPRGASAVYGPQKGADPEMVKRLDAGLGHLAGVIESHLGIAVDGIPGAGAAGGLGAGLIAFLRAELVKGFDLVAGMVGLEERIREADLVITGEGKLDGQTIFGKTPCGVALLAMKHHKPVIAVAGTVSAGIGELTSCGIRVVMPITDGPMSLEESVRRTSELLEDTGRRIAGLIRIGRTAGG